MNNIDVICIGQALLDCITCGNEPFKKNVFRADSINLNVGGDALNEASILKRLGKSVKLVCGIGKDIAGNIVIDIAKERGIDISNVTQSSNITTPIANLMVEKDGSRVSYNSHASMLGIYKPDISVIKDAKIISLASIFRAPLDTKDVIINFIKKAKQEGSIVCVDTKLPTYRKISIDDISEILPYIDYIFPNENEAFYITGKKTYMEMAEEIHKLGVKNVIIKTGKNGCTVYGENDQFELPSLNVNVIDTTGAGDSFVAGFISGILDNKDLRECCNRGLYYAAECIQHTGAV